MIVPSKDELPWISSKQSLEISERHMDQFRKAFGDPLQKKIPTWGAITLQGVFEILNRMQIDWRNLLHATQQFNYLKDWKSPISVTFETKLTDIKFRASTYWLSFETDILDSSDNESIIQSKALLMIREKT